jgi:hypothetical protein
MILQAFRIRPVKQVLPLNDDMESGLKGRIRARENL